MDTRYATANARLDTRAARLTVNYLGSGLFIVTDPERRDDVLVDADPADTGTIGPVDGWHCGCRWGTAGDHCPPGTGRLCSHVRAAALAMLAGAVTDASSAGRPTPARRRPAR